MWESSGPESARALEHLCQIYWQPAYWFFRAKGVPPDDARDVTQEFFATLIEKNSFAKADPARGRFRSFLLASASNFLSNERKRALAIRRGAGAAHLDFEEAEYLYAQHAQSGHSPETAFELQWAQSVLAAAIEDLRQEYARAGKAVQFEVLREFLGWHDSDSNHAGAATTLGTTPQAIKVQVHRLRSRLERSLRRIVQETVEDAAAVEEEIAFLIATVSR